MEQDNRYENGKIYRIYIEGVEDICYVGSTTIPLNDRLLAHKYSAKANRQYKFASAPLFEDGNDVAIELLEAYPCASKQELLAKETEWIRKFPEAINKNPAVLSEEEKVEAVKNAMTKYITSEKGQETRKKCKKEWDAANKERIQQYNKANQAKALEMEKERKAAMTPEQKAAYLEKRRLNKNLVITCETCGESITKGNKYRHSLKHQ